MAITDKDSKVIVGTLTKRPLFFNNFLSTLHSSSPYFDKSNIIVIDDTDLGAKAQKAVDTNKCIWIPAIKPWSFAKNANLLIEAALLFEKDLFLCNDDASFITVGAIDHLRTLAEFYPEAGAISPMFKAGVGNELQLTLKGTYEERPEMFYIDSNLCFVAVYLPLRTLKTVGFLNESFDHTVYGFEDTEYCDRIKEHGLKLAITNKVVFDHGVGLRNHSCTFLDLPNFKHMVEKGKQMYILESARRKRLGI